MDKACQRISEQRNGEKGKKIHRANVVTDTFVHTSPRSSDKSLFSVPVNELAGTFFHIFSN